MTQEYYMISDAAKMVEVETHVLRYWEEELNIPITRNEQGHRLYSEENISQFCKIKHWKEQGLQLKAIRLMLNEDGKLAVPQSVVQEALTAESCAPPSVPEEEKETKSLRLQMLLHGLISQAVRENNGELLREVRETVQKELDYQFRMQEELAEVREKKRAEKEEEHYRKLDELLRQSVTSQKEKRKKHSWF